uniref:Uncharacterized protein n=1 Tax=Eutreptiella gymnastica TaxID=73025 RepID=A0A7S1J7L1_9EUGL
MGLEQQLVHVSVHIVRGPHWRHTRYQNTTDQVYPLPSTGDEGATDRVFNWAAIFDADCVSKILPTTLSRGAVRKLDTDVMISDLTLLVASRASGCRSRFLLPVIRTGPWRSFGDSSFLTSSNVSTAPPSVAHSSRALV